MRPRISRFWPALLVVAAIAATAIPVGAQQLGFAQNAILTISADRLFNDSAFGRRVAREIEAESAILAAEFRRIEAELSEEEQRLTELRPTMEPEQFRKLADAFDEKVQKIRETQDAKARALTQRPEEARNAFFEAARPVLAGLMRETGASVILERNTVFLSTNATDITDQAIARIDAAIGDGTPPTDTRQD